MTFSEPTLRLEVRYRVPERCTIKQSRDINRFIFRFRKIPIQRLVDHEAVSVKLSKIDIRRARIRPTCTGKYQIVLREILLIEFPVDIDRLAEKGNQILLDRICNLPENIFRTGVYECKIGLE